MPDTDTLVLELLKQDAGLSMGIFEQEELTSTLRHYSQVNFSFKEIEDLCLELILLLNKADSNGILEAQDMLSLKKIGQLLWGQLFSRQAKEKLKNTQALSLILSLDEALINIPWELLYTGDDFLCLRFNLGRLVRTREQVSPPIYRNLSSPAKKRMLILANPTNDLKGAYQEGLFIRNQFDRKRSQMSIDFKSTDIDTLYVKKNFRDYDLVHFAGHGEFDSYEPKNSGWVLSDGKFSLQDVRTLGEASGLPSLVFSNACYSAGAQAHLIEQDYQKKTYNLASAFLFSGVRHYIGAVRKIEDPVSLNFSKEFYTQLISGKPVGECIRLSRLKLVREYGPLSISWAGYLVYGDPGFVLFRTKLRPVRGRPKINILRYKKALAYFGLAAFILSTSVHLYLRLPTRNPAAYVLFAKSQRLYLSGNNQEVLILAQDIIQRDPLFLAAYPLLADAYQRLGKTEEALKNYFTYALTCEKRQDKKSLAAAYIGIAWIYQTKGEYQRAFEFYQKAVSLSRNSNDRLHEAEALRKLATWHMDKEEYGRALELLMRSSEINRQRQNIWEHRYNLACDYFDIGLVFSNKDDFTSAKEFYNKSRVLFEKLRLKKELSDYYFNVGEIYLFDKEYQKALDYYLKGLNIDKAQGNKPSLASDYNMLGELYLAMDNYPKAEESFMQAISGSKEIDARPELADASYNLGHLYKKRNQKNKSREYLRQAQEIFSQIDRPRYEEIKKALLDFEVE